MVDRRAEGWAPEGRLSLTISFIFEEPENWKGLALRGSELLNVRAIQAVAGGEAAGGIRPSREEAALAELSGHLQESSQWTAHSSSGRVRTLILPGEACTDEGSQWPLPTLALLRHPE